ncbi:MAG TPA: DUF5668 domain-containing protein [Thermoleophilia bacterium]|nr:DUF5668 domain-containing protein [Thermoleophilia bacterium]
MTDREQNGGGETPEEISAAATESEVETESWPDEPAPGPPSDTQSSSPPPANAPPPPADALPPVSPPADTPPPTPSTAAVPPPPIETRGDSEQEDHDGPRRTVGIILIVLGAWFFLDQFFDFWNWGELWPVLLILLGLVLLFRR